MLFRFLLIILGFCLLAISAKGLAWVIYDNYRKGEPHPSQTPPWLTWESTGD